MPAGQGVDDRRRSDTAAGAIVAPGHLTADFRVVKYFP